MFGIFVFLTHADPEEKYIYYLLPNSCPRGRTAVGMHVQGRDRLVSEWTGFLEIKHSRNLKTCGEDPLDRVDFVLASHRFCNFGLGFLLVGETLFVSSSSPCG